MIFRSGWVWGLAIAAFLSAGCATGADGDTYWDDEGGGGPASDASADEQADTGSGSAAHEAGGRASDAAAAQDSGQHGSQDAAGVDSSHEDAGQDASAGDDGPVDDASSDTSEGDAEGDAGADDGGTMEGGGGCNAQNCNGCCNGNHCVSGTSNHACGTAGGACQDCSALGDSCVSGACQAPTGGTCSKTCGGCCDNNSACHGQASAQYCPTNNGSLFQPGGPCEDCTAKGDTQCFLDIIAYVCLP